MYRNGLAIISIDPLPTDKPLGPQQPRLPQSINCHPRLRAHLGTDITPRPNPIKNRNHSTNEIGRNLFSIGNNGKDFLTKNKLDRDWKRSRKKEGRSGASSTCLAAEDSEGVRKAAAEKACVAHRHCDWTGSEMIATRGKNALLLWYIYKATHSSAPALPPVRFRVQNSSRAPGRTRGRPSLGRVKSEYLYLFIYLFICRFFF